ncbi:MAG: hypothetical protein Q7R52_00340 [archaeon]|nr:hypothetical protein [archaeon]
MILEKIANITTASPNLTRGAGGVIGAFAGYAAGQYISNGDSCAGVGIGIVGGIFGTFVGNMFACMYETN